MSGTIACVQAYNAALENKDREGLQKLLHPSYKLRAPFIEMDAAQLLQFVQSWPFPAHKKDCRFICEGSQVVQIFEWSMAGAFPLSIEMCEVLEVEQGQIKSARMFYDTALFPPGAHQMMQGFLGTGS